MSQEKNFFQEEIAIDYLSGSKYRQYPNYFGLTGHLSRILGERIPRIQVGDPYVKGALTAYQQSIIFHNLCNIEMKEKYEDHILSSFTLHRCMALILSGSMLIDFESGEQRVDVSFVLNIPARAHRYTGQLLFLLNDNFKMYKNECGLELYGAMTAGGLLDQRLSGHQDNSYCYWNICDGVFAPFLGNVGIPASKIVCENLLYGDKDASVLSVDTRGNLFCSILYPMYGNKKRGIIRSHKFHIDMYKSKDK